MKNAVIVLYLDNKDKHYLWYPVKAGENVSHKDVLESISQKNYEFDKARINIANKVKIFTKTIDGWTENDK